MSKFFNFALLFLAVGWVGSCNEDSNKCSPPRLVSRAVIQFHPSLLKEEIDWKRERDFCLSEEVLEDLADSYGIDTEDLRSHLKFFVDSTRNQFVIWVEHEQERLSPKLRDDVAARYVEMRNAREGQVALQNIELTDSEESWDERFVYLKRRDDRTRKVVKESGPDVTLEQDRLTYEKAKAALEEVEEE